MKNIIKAICISLLILTIYNSELFCQSDTYKDKHSFVPMGVDTTVAYKARIKADRLFVDLKSQQLADSLINYTRDYLDDLEELYVILREKKENLKKNRHLFEKLELKKKNQQLLTIEDKREYAQKRNQISNDSLTIAIVTNLINYSLDYCDLYFQKANKIDSFNPKNYPSMANCYWDKGIMFQDTLGHRRAVQVLLKFLENDKGHYFVYHQIGKNYYELKQWEKAYSYVRRAKKILFITSSFEQQEQKKSEVKYKDVKIPGNIDPVGYFRLIRDNGKAEMKMYLADSAMTSLKLAYRLAPTQTDSSEIEKYRDWILWDDGNIRASELKDAIDDSVRNENYKWAKKAYTDSLLPIIKTKAARHNVIWKLARIEYTALSELELNKIDSDEDKQKEHESELHELKQRSLKLREQAANRLYQLVVEADSIKAKPNFYVPPPDSLYKVYFKDCGQMFFDLADRYRNDGLHKKARLFFVKDTTIDWQGRAKSFIHLALLSQVVEFPAAQRKQKACRLAIKLLNRALTFRKDLTEKEIDLAYNYLINNWKQTNPRKVPEIYERWKRERETRGKII